MNADIQSACNGPSCDAESDYSLSPDEVESHNAGRAPGEVAQAPPEILSVLGDQVDADGNVKPADPDAAMENGGGGHEGAHGAAGHGAAHGSEGGHGAAHGPGTGDELNVHNVYESARDAGIDADKFLADYVADDSNFNEGQTDAQKMIGALTVLNDLTASATMGGLEGKSEQEIMSTAGQATTAALDGDVAGLREILTEAGGNVRGFGDEQLLEMWTTNSHYYNHDILNNDSDGFTLSHLGQLNTEDAGRTEPLGGYNNNMDNPQNNFFDGSNAFVDEYLPQSFPNVRIQDEIAAARGA